MKRAFLLSLLTGIWLCGCDGEGLIMNGGRCDFDDDCKSNLCVKGVCRASDGRGGSILNGQACTSNEQCVSNNCYEGKVCRTSNWSGVAKLEVGIACSNNDNCMSNNCVSGVCNPEGVMDAKIANGLACSSNDQCASSNCYEGKVCRTKNWGGTSGKVGNGESCTSDDQCVSNNCYEGKICRPPDWDGSVKLEIGDPCSSNDQCASGYCYNNYVCRNKGDNGGGSNVSTSDANNKYCNAVMNECNLDIYRSYEGCVEAMGVMRNLKPNCVKEWDAAYICIAAQTCDELEHYDRALSELDDLDDPYFYVMNNCQAMATDYIKCKKIIY